MDQVAQWVPRATVKGPAAVPEIRPRRNCVDHLLPLSTTPVAAARNPRKVNRWPARLDLAQSGSGLVLALFMWCHMVFVSTILISRDAMWRVARFFEGSLLFSHPQPWLVTGAVAVVSLILVLHAALALRKFPASLRQWREMRLHARSMQHGDTTLWLWQVMTGYALFFLAPAHLFVMMSRPDRIGPFESGDRMWSDHYWPLYLLLLFAVELHGGIGLYRLALKWDGFGNGPVVRQRLKTLKWALTAGLLALGLATLVAYVRIGIEHAPLAGQPYVPTTGAAR
jgi:fumarate reductase subunit C